MPQIIRGVIHGKTIELESATNLEDGRIVEVMLRPKRLPGPPPGWDPTNPRTAAGSMAPCWTEEDDRILEQIHQERKQESRREVVE